MDEQHAIPWWYLSFVNDHRFLGAIYIEAWDIKDGIDRAHLLGLNPGGQVMTIGPLDAEHMDTHVPTANRYRLLTRAEIE